MKRNEPILCYVGGGSYTWGPMLLRDILASRELEGMEVRLYDINPSACRDVANTLPILEKRAKNHIRVKIMKDLDAALEGADYVLITIQVGGLTQYQREIDIPYKWGSFAPVGGTTGPGTVLRTMVNGPVFLDIARRMERLCPDAWILNLTNPLTTLGRIVSKNTRIPMIGICHGIWSCVGFVANALNVPREDIKLNFGGVNHGSYVWDVFVKGVSVYDDVRRILRERYRSGLAEHENEVDPLGHVSGNYVRYEVLDELGFLAGNGDRHHAEFYRYFLADGGRRYRVRPTRVERRIMGLAVGARQYALDIASGKRTLPVEAGGEPVNDIILARHFNKPWYGPVNVPNTGQIPNLPMDAVVESPGVIDAAGIRPVYAGPIPMEIYPYMATQVAIHELCVEAAETGDPEKAVAAVLADPLTRDWKSARPMVREMLHASRSLIPHKVRTLVRPGASFLGSHDKSLAAMAGLSDNCLVDYSTAFFREAGHGQRWDNPDMSTAVRIGNAGARAKVERRRLDATGREVLDAALAAAATWPEGGYDFRWFLQSIRLERGGYEFVIAADQLEITSNEKGEFRGPGAYQHLYFQPAFAVSGLTGKSGGLLRRGVYVRRVAAFAALDEQPFADAGELARLLKLGPPEAVLLAGQKAYRGMDALTYDPSAWVERLPARARTRTILKAVKAAETDLQLVETLLRSGETMPLSVRHVVERLAGQVYFSLAT